MATHGETEQIKRQKIEVPKPIEADHSFVPYHELGQKMIHVGNVDTPVTVDLGNDTILCDGEILYLTAANPNADYLWQNGSNDSAYEVTKSGSYSVIVSNTCGINYDETNVTFENCECILVPNSFTPNNDGINDLFSSVSRCDFSEYDLIIFNRWGEKIFEANRPEIYWDGKYKEKYATTGVYVYELSYKLTNTFEIIKRHGHISLIR